MNKIFFVVIFFVLSLSVKAQLDTEHWFAPMFDRNTTGGSYVHMAQQNLFLSTNETSSIDVEIYSGNKLLTTIKGVSKGSPRYYSVPREYIISTNFNDLGSDVKINKGLYLKGTGKFFANLRFSTRNHAEILTSKGKAGIGTKFYAVMTPVRSDSYLTNSMVGILATEDNTIVRISGYDNRVKLTNIFPTPQSIEITLNKGESYIIEGGGKDASLFTGTGLIGAKIEASKPISVTNGNFNGQYVLGGEGTDIIMDQSVPVERLGNEFTIIKGNGVIGDDMEGAIIVATENNTQIYINDETSPITTLNEGEYYIVSDTKFINRGNNHYNLYVKSSKNIYLYQLLGGVSTSTATEGFNYIPPLNCFLPHQVGEIGGIDTMFGSGTDGYYSSVPTKLNFITLKGAVVNVDRYPLTPANGPFDIAGTSEWVSYSIPNVTGNINIHSTKSITAGISAGSGYAGYGGYFAGFSTIAVIKKTGDCIPNVTLEVEGDYENYQWYRNGVEIIGENSKNYKPTEAGIYKVRLQNSNCFQMTSEVKIQNCQVETTTNANVCGAKVFIPTFSKSTQEIDLSTIKIISSPKKGKLNVDIANTAKITYTPNQGEVGEDSFSYQFCGKNKDFPDCEKVTVNLVIGEIGIQNAVLTTCKHNGKGIFNLTSADIRNTENYPVTYYSTYADANKGENAIPNPSVYSSSGGKVYAKAVSPEGCEKIVEISLSFFDEPKVNISNYSSIHCDANFDGKIDINFSEITASITDKNNSVTYHLSQIDAENGSNPLPNFWAYYQNTDVYVRVVSGNGCVSNIEKISFQIKGKLVLNSPKMPIELCDDDFDGVKKVNLVDYHSLFTSKTANVTYYENLADAQKAMNSVTETYATNGKTYYLRFETGTECPSIQSITFSVKKPKKSESLKDIAICSTATAELDAGVGFKEYRWSTGEMTQKITVGVGDYWVDLVSNNGCVYRQNIKVSAIEIPKIESIDIKKDVVIIKVVGDESSYLYSLDGGAWQSSNIFTGVNNGTHIVGVKSIKGECEPVYQSFTNIHLVNFITPNGDGVNDVIDYSELRTKSNVKFQIYDRYGALVFEGNSVNQFIWDGKAKGRPLPTASYWYLIEWQEPNTNTWIKKASWILLKNRD